MRTRTDRWTDQAVIHFEEGKSKENKPRKSGKGRRPPCSAVGDFPSFTAEPSCHAPSSPLLHFKELQGALPQFLASVLATAQTLKSIEPQRAGRRARPSIILNKVGVCFYTLLALPQCGGRWGCDLFTPSEEERQTGE